MHTDLTVKGHRSASFFKICAMDKKLDIRRGMSYVRLVVITLWSLIQDTQFLRKNPIKDQGVVKNKGGKDRE